MPTIKLGRRACAAIAPADRPMTWWDADLKGFGLLVRPTGARSWIVEYRPGAGGRNIAKRRVVLGDPEAMTPETARAAAKTMLAAVRLGSDPAQERSEARAAQSVSEIMDTWLTRHVNAKRKGTTASLYRQVVVTHIAPRIGARRAISVVRQDIARLHDEIASEGREERQKTRSRGDGPVRGGTYVANRTLAIISSAWNWAMKVGLLPEDHRNPVTGIEKFREISRDRFLTTNELARLGAALRDAGSVGLPWQVDVLKPASKHTPKINQRTVLPPHIVAAFQLLIFTGARLGEILKLEWSQVDLGRAMLFLPDSKTGTTAILLAAPAASVLADLPRLGRYVVASESAGTSEEQPRTDLKKPWRLITRCANLDGLRIHDLRHSYASVGAAGGIGLPLLGGVLGHADPKTTQRYAHLANDPLRRAADLIAANLSASLFPDQLGHRPATDACPLVD